MDNDNTTNTPLRITNERTHVAHSRLRLVAPQAKFAAETYRESHLAISVRPDGIIEVAEAFIATYDASRIKSPDSAQESKELREVTRLPQTDMQAWMGALATPSWSACAKPFVWSFAAPTRTTRRS